MLIGELARAAGTTPRAIRYYEQQGLLDACRTSSGYRDYSAAALKRVRNIRALLSLGFSTEEVQVFLPCLDSDIEDDMKAGGVCPASAPLIARKVAVLDEEISRLTRMRDQLGAALAVRERGAD